MRFFFMYLYLLLVSISCTVKESTGLLCRIPSCDTIHITPGKLLNRNLDSTQYDIIGVIELQLPNEIPCMGVYSPTINDSTIVFLDELISKKVLSFDMSGVFLGELGRIGHSKNEYVEIPNNISFDSEGHIHMFSQAGMKILEYDRNGKFQNVQSIKYHPAAATIVGKGKYLFAFSYQEEHKSRLCVYDTFDKNISKLMNISEDEHEISYTFPFSQNKSETFFVPLLADSVIVFDGENVKKILHIDFDGKFLPTEVRDEALREKGLEIVFNHQGVNYVNRFEASDKYYFVEYAYTKEGCQTENWCSLIDRKTNKVIFNSPYGFLKGVNPYSTYYVYNDYIYFIVDSEVVEKMNNDYNPLFYPDLWKCVPQTMRNIMNGTIKLPALVKIRLK